MKLLHLSEGRKAFNGFVSGSAEFRYDTDDMVRESLTTKLHLDHRINMRSQLGFIVQMNNLFNFFMKKRFVKVFNI